MKLKFASTLLIAGLVLLAPGALTAGTITTGTILYGGVGGHPAGEDSTNVGALVIVNQSTAALTILNAPEPGVRLAGIAFDASGTLFGTTQGSGLPPITSSLLLIDPDTGSLISVIGPVTNGPGGPVISMAKLTVQPGTDVLYGLRPPTDLMGGGGKLYTINKTTAVATLVGSTPDRRGSLAFTPGGTLYESALIPGPPTLFTIDPSNAAVLASIATAEQYGAMASRPTDSVLYVGDGDPGEILTLVPATGLATPVGNTGTTVLGALAFRSCVIDINGATANPSVLWPPNGQLVNVSIGYTATDTCGAAAAPVTCSLSIASNEGSSADWSVVDAHDVKLRAERSGGGGDRTYTVTITCSDTAGASSNAAVTVTVPHDQR